MMNSHELCRNVDGLKAQTDGIPQSKLVLELMLGPVPSFKNRKRIARGWLYTERRVKRWMQAATASLESQLLCAFRACEHATPTAAPLPYWIASSLPKDDCWRYVPELTVTSQICPPDHDGATITIEPL